MSNLNKVTLQGRLTKVCELRYTSNNNTAVASFTIAVDRKVRQGEQKQTDFINIVAWSKLAEFCAKYFSKGQQIIVVGRIQTRTYDGNDGKKVYITEVVAEECFFSGDKKSGTQPQESDNVGGFNPMDDDDELPF